MNKNTKPPKKLLKKPLLRRKPLKKRRLKLLHLNLRKRLRMRKMLRRSDDFPISLD